MGVKGAHRRSGGDHLGGGGGRGLCHDSCHEPSRVQISVTLLLSSGQKLHLKKGNTFWNYLLEGHNLHLLL